MNLTLRKLIDSSEALKNIGNDKTLDVKSKYLIARNISIIQPELESYERERIQLIEHKYGKKDEVGSISVPIENKDSFMSELEKLLDIEVELNISKIPLEACKNISATDMYFLNWMITEE